MRILAGIDLSESTKTVICQTETIAKMGSAKIWLLHIAEPEPDFVGFEAGPQSVRDAWSEEFHDQHRQLQELARGLCDSGLDAAALLAQGAIAETILKEAAKVQADMIIIGSGGHGLIHRLFSGSVIQEILQKSESPVLVVPTHHKTP